ncbi:MAG: TonB-dependent receptor [Gemmatimonadales bacterium]
MSGVVITADGARVPGATVRLRHLDRAGLWVEPADEDGRFRFERLPPGGPYELEAIAIGHRPARAGGLALELGRELRVEIRLGESAAVLSEIRVIGELVAPGGPTYLVPAEAIRGLPLFNRSFVGLLQLVPHAVGRPGPSFGGQNSRYNSFRIDGTIANDLFGLGLTPGGEAGAPPISIEAVEGVRIQVAPFDVRQGGFSGGAIEAVTRSGGNRLEVSAVGAVQRGDLIGGGPDGRGKPALDLLQWGVTVGGPIRRDRLHFFLALDLQARDTTYQGPEAGDPAAPVSEETARRIQAELIRRFGFDPGGAEPPVTRQPNGSVLAKLSWRPTARHEVDLGYQRSFARSDGFDRENPARGNGWMLSESGYERRATIDALRLRARSTLGVARNELIAGFQSSRESRDSRLRAPLFLVQADVAGAFVAGGSFRNAQGTLLDQRQVELIDHLTVPLGGHELLVGGGIEAFHFVDNLLLLRWGSWTFGSVDSLERGVPSLYEVGLPPAPGAASPVADFSARTVAAYLQDRWTPGRGVSISAGLRVEAPFVEAPTTNPTLAASTALRIDTGRFPSGGLRLAEDRALLVARPRRADRPADGVRRLRHATALRLAQQRVHQYRSGASAADLRAGHRRAGADRRSWRAPHLVSRQLESGGRGSDRRAGARTPSAERAEAGRRFRSAAPRLECLGRSGRRMVPLGAHAGRPQPGRDRLERRGPGDVRRDRRRRRGVARQTRSRIRSRVPVPERGR